MTATLPRSVLLAAWGTAALAGSVSADQVRRAVETTAADAPDEPHGVTVVGAAPLRGCDGGSLVSLVAELRREGVRALRVVLPAPGDVLGLPGPADLNADALDAGECVVGVGGPPLALVPSVTAFGSTWEPGTEVTWHVHAAGHGGATDLGGAAEAERHLRLALTQGIAALNDLDVARWRDEAVDEIEDLRHGPGPSHLLPPGASPRAVRVVDLAWRVRGIARLASEDHGGTVSGWEVTERSQTLRELESIGRRALVAAANDAVAQQF